MFALRRGERKGNFSVSGTLNTAFACELRPPASDIFNEQLEYMARKTGEAMSSPFLARCPLAGLIALLPITAPFAPSASAGPPVSANDLLRAVVANELALVDRAASCIPYVARLQVAAATYSLLHRHHRLG